MSTKPAFLAFLLAAAPAAFAQQAPASPVTPRDKTQASPRLNPAVQARAERLSSQMVRSLRLNGYQAERLRAINADKVAKMDAIERQHASNPKLVDEQCQGVCRERDQELQAVLTTDQYTDYFDSRSTFYKYDKDYAKTAATALLINSVQNPAPVRANDAVIGPAKTVRSSEPIGRSARQ